MKNPFPAIGRFFARIGKAIAAALGASKIDDAAVELALKWVRVAANKFAENAEKREWVVGILIQKGFSESVARLAVELAYQLYKYEVAQGNL